MTMLGWAVAAWLLLLLIAGFVVATNLDAVLPVLWLMTLAFATLRTFADAAEAYWAQPSDHRDPGAAVRAGLACWPNRYRALVAWFRHQRREHPVGYAALSVLGGMGVLALAYGNVVVRGVVLGLVFGAANIAATILLLLGVALSSGRRK